MSLGFTRFAMLSSDIVDSDLLFPVLFAFVSSIVISLCSIALREPWVASSMSLLVLVLLLFGMERWRGIWIWIYFKDRYL